MDRKQGAENMGQNIVQKTRSVKTGAQKTRVSRTLFRQIISCIGRFLGLGEGGHEFRVKLICPCGIA